MIFPRGWCDKGRRITHNFFIFNYLTPFINIFCIKKAFVVKSSLDKLSHLTNSFSEAMEVGTFFSKLKTVLSFTPGSLPNSFWLDLFSNPTPKKANAGMLQLLSN